MLLWPFLIFIFIRSRTYSYCRATAGSSLAALLAGQIPKNRPTQAEKVIEPKIAMTGITKGNSEIEAAKKYIKVPTKAPIMPPITHKIA